VAEQRLQVGDCGTALEEVAGERVAQGVKGQALPTRQPGKD
jgi:hypothetical protein